MSTALTRAATLVTVLFGLLAALVTVAPSAGDETLPDGRRVALGDTTKGPARWVGQIEFESPDPKQVRKDGSRKTYRGSGALIGPRHVLTAAHVIWGVDLKRFGNKDGFPPDTTDIWFTPGLNGEQAPFGKAKVVGIHFQKMFAQVTAEMVATGAAFGDDVSKMHTDRDLAVLLLDTDLSKKAGGFFRYAAVSDNQITSINETADKFRSNGYDAIESYPGRQFTRNGIIARNRQFVIGRSGRRHPVNLFHAGWPQAKGGSGGPVWVELFGGQPTVVGVISNVEDPPRAIVRGPLLDDFYVRWIGQYVKDNP